MCRGWRGSFDRDGYPRAWWQGHYVRTGRLLYTWQRGEIPKGWTLDHTCGHRWCMESAHYEPITRAEHARREAERKRQDVASAELAVAAVAPALVEPAERCCQVEAPNHNRYYSGGVKTPQHVVVARLKLTKPPRQCHIWLGRDDRRRMVAQAAPALACLVPAGGRGGAGVGLDCRPGQRDPTVTTKAPGCMPELKEISPPRRVLKPSLKERNVWLARVGVRDPRWVARHCTHPQVKSSGTAEHPPGARL
jgi:hypothetical protein